MASLSVDLSLSWIFPGAMVLGGDLRISQGEQLASSSHMSPEATQASALTNNTATATEPAGGSREAGRLRELTRQQIPGSESCCTLRLESEAQTCMSERTSSAAKR